MRVAPFFLMLPAVVAIEMCLAAPAVAQTAPPVVLKGAGASFPAPLYYRWTELYNKANSSVKLSYDSVGSGDGVARFIADSVDFGASDSAMTDAEMSKVSRGALLVPSTAGMVSLVYNLPGLEGTLRLSREAYSQILQGAITQWNDPRITKTNPKLVLPARNIAVVARLDKSGTTFALTNHLGSASEAWRRERGVGTWVEWPRTVMLARGNEGVASRVKISEGSIGYVEYGFAKRLGLPMATIENRAGNFVEPSEKTGQAALAEALPAMTQTMRVFVPDPKASDAYPITTLTWLLIYRDYRDDTKKLALRDFVHWALTSGQQHGAELGYFPLPPGVLEKAKIVLQQIK